MSDFPQSREADVLIKGIVVFCLLPVVFAAQLQAQDIGLSDTVRTGCSGFVDVNRTDTFSIPIYIFSDEPLNEIEITFAFSSALITPLEFRPAGYLAICGQPSCVLGSSVVDNRLIIQWSASEPQFAMPADPSDVRLVGLVHGQVTYGISPGCYDLDTTDEAGSVSALRLSSPGAAPFIPIWRACGEFYVDSIWVAPKPLEGGTICFDYFDAIDESGDNSVDRPIVSMYNFPNPFNSGTTIELDIPSSSHLSIVIYDILGRHVRTIIDDFVSRGPHQLAWDGNNESGKPAASGIYFASVSSTSVKATRRLVLLR